MCYPHHFLPRTDFLSPQCNWVLFQTVPAEETTAAIESCGDESGKRRCLCSPTTHPGSFRCRLHRSEYVWVARRRTVKNVSAEVKVLTNDK
ncbi:hypothetical protein E6C27_scaffold114G001380 [Cucumis melo var. makuwa]|uniref:Uncharacterized protein n=1 Tax=Cucumis melo var. makuwa TaxID=1194695 RepID=A0A5A7TXE6_CUCMM|nr:hypothetical protein E6C27_scaffold114G001380 [Cucumis melo var. makuwa]